MPKVSKRQRETAHWRAVKKAMKPEEIKRCPSVSPVGLGQPRNKPQDEGWLQKLGHGAAWCVGVLTVTVKVLLILALLMILFSLYHQSVRVTRVLDLMAAAWTMLLEVMKRSGLVEKFEAPPELAKYTRLAKNMSWPVCRQD